MNANDPEMEHRLKQLRQMAEPLPADKRHVLESLRASLLSSRELPDNQGKWPRPQPSMKVGRAGAAARSSSGARRLAPWGGALIGGAVGLALGFGWGSAGDSRTERDRSGQSPPSSAAVAVPSAVPERPAPPAAIVPEHSPAITPAPLHLPGAEPSGARLPAPRARRREVARPTELDLKGALELLHRAEQALHAGDPQLALGLLGDLDRRAGRVALRQERLTTLVLALCEQGRAADARAAREELQREFPASIYGGRVERSCAGEAEPR